MAWASSSVRSVVAGRPAMRSPSPFPLPKTMPLGRFIDTVFENIYRPYWSLFNPIWDRCFALKTTRFAHPRVPEFGASNTIPLPSIPIGPKISPANPLIYFRRGSFKITPERSALPMNIRRKTVGASLLMALLFITGTCVYAVDPSKPMREYVRDSWGTADGLPQNSILAIVQTKDGYLWFGTQEGLVRFNGAQFTTFSPSSASTLRFNAVGALLEDRRDGTLLVGTYRAGVLRYHAGQFTSYAVEAGSPENNINALAQDSRDEIWVATDKGLHLLRSGKLAPYTQSKELGGQITALAVAPDGALWVTTDSDVFRVNQGITTRIRADENIHSPSALYFDRSGVLWIGTIAHGLYSFSAGKLTHYTTGNSPATRINTIYQDQEGTLWVGLYKGGACRLQSRKFDCYTQANGLTDNLVNALYGDREGSLWIG